MWQPTTVNTHFYVIVSGSAEVLHHPVGQTKAIRARMGTGGQSGAIVVSSADRARLGCRVGVLSHGMCFGELSASGEARDSSVVALGLSDPDTMTREPTQLLQVDVDGKHASSSTTTAYGLSPWCSHTSVMCVYGSVPQVCTTCVVPRRACPA